MALIRTKLFIPQLRPNLVARPGLVKQMEEGLAGKVTLISAPPGFGKTTLLGEWARVSSLPIAWLSLDERDNDPIRFLSYLVAALQTIEPGLGKLILEKRQSDQKLPVEAILTALINEIAALTGPAGKPLVLVLDDYHLITARPVHEAISFLIDFLPPQLHVIVAGRIDPDLPLARLRVLGGLTELRATDLRFRDDEIAAFFRKTMGLNLAPADIAALQQRTEGWVAGLQVAALSMRGHDDVAGFIQAFTGSNRFILDYLVEEVLERQPEEIRTFLLRTAILDHLSGPLCDALTGRNDGREMLERLERANLFLLPVDDGRRWYRYHPLFAEFLRGRLAATQPELLPVLHRKAARWLEENGQPAEAVDHALSAGDEEMVAGLVEQSVREIITRGEWATLQRWLDGVGEEWVRERPRLALVQAWALLFTAPAAATESWLQVAEERLPPGPGSEKTLRGEIGAIRALTASALGDTERTITLGEEALGLLPVDDLFLRGMVVLAMGYAYRFSGAVLSAQTCFKEVIALGRATGNLYQLLDGLYNLANQQLMHGRRREAIENAQQAVQIIESTSGEPLSISAEIHLVNTVILYEGNKLEEASEHIRRAITLSEREGLAELQYTGHIWYSLVAQALGNMGLAMEQMVAAERLAGRLNNSRILAHAAASRTRLALSMGDLASATGWLTSVKEPGDERPATLPPIKEYEELTRVAVYLALDKVAEASALLARLRPPAEAAGRFDHVYRMMAFQSLALEARGELTAALDTLGELLSLAAPEGYVRLFVDLGRPMFNLLRRAAAGGLEPPAVRRLLLAFEINGEPAATPELLSDREQEVLVLIAAGRSNRAIAGELVITVGTVKRHVSNIFRKLDVNSRTQAVDKARELGLLT